MGAAALDGARLRYAISFAGSSPAVGMKQVCMTTTNHSGRPMGRGGSPG
jgi:hypothetical protein